MDHFKIIKRAFGIVWNYRMLWVFGIILALVAGGNRGFGGNGSGFQFSGDRAGRLGRVPGNLPFGWHRTFSGLSAARNWVLIAIGVGFGLACLALILAVVTTVVRNVVRTSLIRMVDEYEDSGEKLSFKQGWCLGWSRRAFKMWLINLILDVPVAVVTIGMNLLAAAPAALWFTRRQVLGIIGTVAAIGLFFLVVLLAIVVGVVIKLLKRFFWRRAAIEDDTVGDSFREGFGLVQRHLGDVALMWLLMVGIGIAWVIAMIPVSIILLILFGALGAIVAALPGLAVAGIASIFTSGATPWIIGAIVALPILMLIISAPFVFLNGLYEAFKSTVWTLTYREVRALDQGLPGVPGDSLSALEEGPRERGSLPNLSADDGIASDG